MSRSGPARFLSRAYRLPAEPFQAVSADGVRLVGHRVGEARTALVFCHGFSGWHRKPRLVRFQESLADRFSVYAFDLRGHGESEGCCAFGASEHLDVDAIVRLARSRRHDRVVTFGASMGGIAAIRHAALLGWVEAVVAVSTPARWLGHESGAVRRLIWLTATERGRRLLRACGIRVTAAWDRVPEPADVVGSVAPTPLILVHGRDDHFFDEEQAWELYRRARSPKRLLLASRFGHAEDAFTPAFAERISRAIEEALAERPPEPASVPAAPARAAGGPPALEPEPAGAHEG